MPIRKDYHSIKAASKPWYKNYRNMQRRCNSIIHKNYHRYGGRGIKCLISLDELEIIWYRDQAFLMSSPSVDRIDNDKSYTFENCRFIENSKNNRPSTKIIKVEKDGSEELFLSIANAAEFLKKDKRNIVKCLEGKRNTAYGYVWRYYDSSNS